MRGELQKAGSSLAAERQQTDQQAAMLMEQLAITQATSADTKVHLTSVPLLCLQVGAYLHPCRVCESFKSASCSSRYS